MRVLATGLLGDLWRRMLYDFSNFRVLGNSWYEI